MVSTTHDYSGLSTREGFNKSLRHFKAVMGIISELEDKVNLADILQSMIEDKELEQEQIAPIIQSLLVDKYKYKYRSFNLKNSVTDFENTVSKCSNLTAVDLVVVYYHPELGITPINPKNIKHWESVQELKKNELLVVYSGYFDKTEDKKLYTDAIDLFYKILMGETVKIPASMKRGSLKPPQPATKPAFMEKKAPKEKKVEATVQKPKGKEIKQGKRRMTPLYSIPVTNELFHNGNVEAWKKIIESYKAKHPDLDVYIFYEGERIHDINTLFKWGKVKHGSAILISVAGENIKDVAKLQRYLKQGASPMFEAFLKFPVNTVLNLF